MTVALPPNMGGSRPNRILEIQTSDLKELRYTEDSFGYSTVKVEVQLEGESARRILQAVDPYSSAIIGGVPITAREPINHQDEALAAARRDANEANARAAASRQLAVELEESLMDYEGEINALRQELGLDPKPADGWMKKLSAGGYIDPKSTILAVDPGLPPATAPMIEYSKADVEIVRKGLENMINQRQSDHALARIHNEKYTLEWE
ncbi:hypothetical protein SEA_A3WALLY_230 [Microbacterium phage A3Wally]|nr:hypothetical protein SEA_A3WALLY_230 [Microbacterium phage A3Wally]